MQSDQKSQKMAYYARILLIFSITLLIYGIILDYNSTQHLIDPVRDVEIIDTGNTVTVSTIDEVDPTEDSSSIVEEKDIDSNVDAKVVTIEDTNDKLRTSLQNKYGIIIRYGDETVGYSVTSEDTVIKTEPIVDPNVINSQLTRLNSVLSLYPSNLFIEIKSAGIPLTIYLVDSFSNASITGITDSSYSFANISIAAMYPFEESFFHESYHYIERYLFKRKANFNSWDSLNPNGFEYGTIRTEWSYSNTFSQDAYFVNNYAQSAATADRASTFEYMMAPNKASCLNENSPVWKKARYMALTMEKTIHCVKSDTTEYWERFL